jgi:hypothetical protein
VLTLVLHKKQFRNIWKERAFLFLGGFAVWTLLVNIYYFSIYSEIEFLKDGAMYSIYYLFSLAFYILLTQSDKSIIKIMIYASIIGLIPQFIYTVFINFNPRPLLLFNNKNQLSHWTVFVCTIAAIVYKNYPEIKRFKWAMWASIVIALVVNYITISRAGMAASLLLVGLISIFIDFKSVVVCVVLAIAFTSLHYSMSPKPLEKELEKIKKKYEGHGKYDSFYMRGYWRIAEFPKYALLGAGEKLGKERFDDHHEIHSSYGQMLFCYGLVGISLLFSSYFYFFKGESTLLLFLLPLLFMSLFHNHIRNPYLWMLPVLYYGFRKNIT